MLQRVPQGQAEEPISGPLECASSVFLSPYPTHVVSLRVNSLQMTGIHILDRCLTLCIQKPPDIVQQLGSRAGS